MTTLDISLEKLKKRLKVVSMRKVLLGLFLLLPLLSHGANFEVGMSAYEDGDYATAHSEWLPLAVDGNSGAQFHLGLLYDIGNGVSPNHETAAKWYTRAAEQGHVDAQFNLGVMYADGDGVPQDYEVAVGWLNRAAEQGVPDAQYNLGMMHFEGDGIVQDNISAHMWFNIAASNGEDEAYEMRREVAQEMTPDEIGEARELAMQCLGTDYKEC